MSNVSIKTESLYSVEIDFDGAQKAWRENKKALDNGVLNIYAVILQNQVENV